MYIQVDNANTFIATGGKPFAAHLPTVVLLHGSGTDHRLGPAGTLVCLPRL